VPELDFILEMAARDEPERWTFVRAGQERTTKALAGWTDVLKGNLLLRYLTRIGVTAGIAGVAAWRKRQQQGGGLKPGLTRGGKPLAGDQD